MLAKERYLIKDQIEEILRQTKHKPNSKQHPIFSDLREQSIGWQLIWQQIKSKKDIRAQRENLRIP
jgi:hypothetical protein